MLKVTGISGFDYYGRGWITFDVSGREVKIETAHSPSPKFEVTQEWQTLNAQIMLMVNMDGADGFYNFCGERDIDEMTEAELKQFESDYTTYLVEFFNDEFNFEEEVPELYCYVISSSKTIEELLFDLI